MSVVHRPNPEAAADTGIATLLQRLRNDAFELVRAELALARAELVTAANDFIRGAMMSVFGAVLLLGGVFALLAAAIIVLNFWLPLWAAASAVGLVLLIAGALTLRAARKKMDAEKLALTHTRHSVQQDLGVITRKTHEQSSPTPRSEYSPDLGSGAAHGAAPSPG